MHHLGQHRFKYYGCGEGIVKYNASSTEVMVNCGKWNTQQYYSIIFFNNFVFLNHLIINSIAILSTSLLDNFTVNSQPIIISTLWTCFVEYNFIYATSTDFVLTNVKFVAQVEGEDCNQTRPKINVLKEFCIKF